MKYFRFTSHLFIALVTLSTTQSQFTFGPDISPQCSSAVQTFLNSSEFNGCFPYNKLSNQMKPYTNFTDFKSDEREIINIADSICSLPKCSDSLISSFNSTFQSKCSDEIAKKKPDTNSIADFIWEYSPLRDSFCFKNSTGGYCLVETIDNIEGINNLEQTYSNLTEQILCTKCNKAILNTFFNYVVSHPPPTDISFLISFLKPLIDSKCNSSFL
ncbi:3235_t:CDS:1, partial [Scutellospora calospora]